MATYTVEQVPSGFKGTKRTIERMWEMAKTDSLRMDIISLARNIIHANRVNPRDNRKIADTLFLWVKQKVSFVRDPSLAEFVQAPHIIIQNRSGDCDDISTLLMSLNLAVGNRGRFVTIGKSRDKYSHVYLQVQDQQKEWVSYDPVVPKSVPGWEAPSIGIKTIWEVNGKVSDIADVEEDEEQSGKYFHIERDYSPMDEAQEDSIVQNVREKKPGDGSIERLINYSEFLTGLGEHVKESGCMGDCSKCKKA